MHIADYFHYHVPVPKPSEPRPRFRVPNPDWWPSAGPDDNYPSPGLFDYIEETTNTLNTLLNTASDGPPSDWQLIQNQLKQLKSVKYVPTDKNQGVKRSETDVADYGTGSHRVPVIVVLYTKIDRRVHSCSG
jgi:hypothetical protein